MRCAEAAGEGVGGYVAEGLNRDLMDHSGVAREIKKRWLVHVFTRDKP
jgi:hypothetical protein